MEGRALGSRGNRWESNLSWQVPTPAEETPRDGSKQHRRSRRRSLSPPREREFEKRLTPGTHRWGLGIWRTVAATPWVYRLATALGARGLRLLSRGGHIRRLPLGGGWTGHRDFPAPEGRTFQAQWRAR